VDARTRRDELAEALQGLTNAERVDYSYSITAHSHQPRRGGVAGAATV
jgi:hypothetical protein